MKTEKEIREKIEFLESISKISTMLERGIFEIEKKQLKWVLEE